jgi:hypothetical protein
MINLHAEMIKFSAKPWIMVVVALMCGSGLVGCGQAKGPPVTKVTGVLKFDGKPLPNTTVRFDSSNGWSSEGTTDDQGQFELQASPNRQGAAPGEYRVEIRAPDKVVPAFPAVYNEETILQAVVKPDVHNSFVINLPKKPTPDMSNVILTSQ